MSEEEIQRLEARVQNLELALVGAISLIEQYMPADCEQSLYKMGKEFYESNALLGSKVFSRSAPSLFVKKVEQ